MPSPLVKARESNATDERPRPECAEKIRTKVFGPIYRIGLYERCDWSSHGITLRILRGGAKRQSDYDCGNRDNCSNGRHISAALGKSTCGSASPSEHSRPSRPCPAGRTETRRGIAWAKVFQCRYGTMKTTRLALVTEHSATATLGAAEYCVSWVPWRQ